MHFFYTNKTNKKIEHSEDIIIISRKCTQPIRIN